MREWGRSSVPMPVKSTQLVLPAAAEASSTLTLIRRRLADSAVCGVHESEVALAELVGVMSEPRIVADERFKGAFADIAGDERTADRFLPLRSHPSSLYDREERGRGDDAEAARRIPRSSERRNRELTAASMHAVKPLYIRGLTSRAYTLGKGYVPSLGENSSAGRSRIDEAESSVRLSLLLGRSVSLSLPSIVPLESDHPTDSNSHAGAEPTPTYSLPHDAFDANPTDSAAASSSASSDPHPQSHSDRPARRNDGAPPYSATAPVPRRRQRQTLSNAEAQAFADLLGEIMPRTAAQPAPSSSSDADAANAGLFGIFASEPGSTTASTARGGIKEGGGDVSKVQQALMRKVGYKMGMQLDPSGTGRWTRKARTELTEQEELELDRLREQLLELKSDYEVLQWGLEKVFGFDKARVNEMMVSPDPNALPVLAAPPSEQQPQLDSNTARATSSYGPQSRLYPDLLLLLFLVLRDTHRNPTCALSLFRLAKSNPFSYVNGCTTAVYLEVLRTHWADGAGDIEAVWQGLDEMRANGVPFDDKVRELVRSIGEAIRIDEERAELRYDLERERGGGAAGVENGEDAHERERQILRRRWFDASQIGAWSRMERIVEENQDELEELRQKREDERWHDSERARRDRFQVERERAHRDRPDLIDRAGSASSLWGPAALSSPVRGSGITAGADGAHDLLHGYGGTRTHTRRSADAARPAWETWKVPIAERDEDGNPIMPKRPSFVNPFKIRRKGLTKEEKARKDTRHPALWWKK